MFEDSFQVSFDFAVFDLSKVDDHDQTIHMSIYITMEWFEPRLIVEDDASERTVVNTKMAKDALWIPAVSMENMIAFHVQHTLSDIDGIVIYKSWKSSKTKFFFIR